MAIHFPLSRRFAAEDYGAAYFAGQQARYEAGVYRQRARWVARYLPARMDGLVLDAGAGLGSFSAVAQARGARVVALDFAPAALAEIALRVPGARRLRGALEHLPLAADSVDRVLALDVLEHLHEPQRLLDELARVLRRGGRALILTDNAASPSRLRGLRRVADLLRRLSPSGRRLEGVRDQHPVPSCHVALYSAAEVAAMVRAAGLELVRHDTFPRQCGALLDALMRLSPLRAHRGGALIAEVVKP